MHSKNVIALSISFSQVQVRKYYARRIIILCTFYLFMFILFMTRYPVVSCLEIQFSPTIRGQR